MNKLHLLGFYRKNGKIETLYSENQYFFDSNLKAKCKAVIAPLGIHKSEYSWVLSNDSSFVHGSLQDILKENKFFITQKKVSTPFSVLMYPKADDLSMSRGGILLEKINNEIRPVIVDIKGVEYITEIKGCGCPLSGFPKLHIRQQSRSYNKGHLRLTGGLDAESAVDEFVNIESLREIRERSVDGLQYRGLGYVLFNYYLQEDSLKMGQVLRLSPSSIRFSFTDNPEIDNLKSNDLKTFILNAGKEVSIFLECDEPVIHQNMSWNNMVFIDKETYIFTDYEEASPVSKGNCSLDFFDHIYPHCFLIEKYRDLYFEDFINGLKSFKGKVKAVIDIAKPNSIRELNRIVFEDCLSLPVFRKRMKNSMDYSFLDENIELVKSFMPDSYVKKNINIWVSEDLLPKMSRELKICVYYEDFSSRFGYDNLTSCLKSENNDPRLQRMFNYVLSNINPLFNKAHADYSKNYTIKDLGSYLDCRNFETYIWVDPVDEVEILERIKKLRKIVNDIKTFIKKKNFDKLDGFVTDLLSERKSVMFENAVTMIYPFIIFVNVYFENERMILNGVNKYKDSIGKHEYRLCKESLKELDKKVLILKEDPGHYHSILCKSSEEFKAYLKLPYMK